MGGRLSRKYFMIGGQCPASLLIPVRNLMLPSLHSCPRIHWFTRLHFYTEVVQLSRNLCVVRGSGCQKLKLLPGTGQPELCDNRHRSIQKLQRVCVPMFEQP